MPELPEVETIKNAIELAIGNGVINKVRVNNNRFRIVVPEDFGDVLEGSRIRAFRRIAKYIVIDLSNGKSIIWHLGMSGKVKISSELPEFFDKHDHIVIETTSGVLIFNDARRFGLITYCESEKILEHPLFKNIGIEPFDDRLDGKYLYERLKTKKIPIKVALLDQSIINGTGNIYASEALYIARIYPRRESADISLKECNKIVDAIKATLEKAIEAGGSTLRDYRKPDGSMGYFQNMHCVYGKTGQQCSECKCDIKKTGGIKKIVQAGRSTFYCETLQK